MSSLRAWIHCLAHMCQRAPVLPHAFLCDRCQRMEKFTLTVPLQVQHMCEAAGHIQGSGDRGPRAALCVRCCRVRLPGLCWLTCSNQNSELGPLPTRIPKPTTASLFIAKHAVVNAKQPNASIHSRGMVYISIPVARGRIHPGRLLWVSPSGTILTYT